VKIRAYSHKNATHEFYVNTLWIYQIV